MCLAKTEVEGEKEADPEVTPGDKENQIHISGGENDIDETCVAESTDFQFSSPPPDCLGNSSDQLSLLSPPPSCIERSRDNLLRFLELSINRAISRIILVLIIVDGAFFFFLLVGLHRMCPSGSSTDCEPRNWWYNFSVQLLNALFTYSAAVSLPWRVANAFHLIGGRRSSRAGDDLYGRPTDQIWFHIPPKKRLGITALLVGNSIAQFANQATRVVFYSYELQSSFPGSLWTNAFFLLSMALAAIAGFWQIHEETLLRTENQEKFQPGVLAIIDKCVSRRKQGAEEKDTDVATDRSLDEMEGAETATASSSQSFRGNIFLSA